MEVSGMGSVNANKSLTWMQIVRRLRALGCGTLEDISRASGLHLSVVLGLHQRGLIPSPILFGNVPLYMVKRAVKAIKQRKGNHCIEN